MVKNQTVINLKNPGCKTQDVVLSASPLGFCPKRETTNTSYTSCLSASPKGMRIGADRSIINKRKIKFLGRGLINDSISDMLTRIRNKSLIKKSTVLVPYTKMTKQIVHILEKEGFILSYKVSLKERSIIIHLKYKVKKVYKGRHKVCCITNLKRLSKPGLRVYANHSEIPRILSGVGIVIVSTPEGIMTGREARMRGLGGELLCSIW